MAPIDEPLREYYYNFPNGSKRYILRKCRSILDRLDPDNEELAEQIDEALDLTRHTGELELQWKTGERSRSQARQEATVTDDKIDRTVSSIYEVVDANAGMETENRKRRLAREIREALFQNGVFPITSPEFDQQHVHVRDLLERLDRDFSEHVDALGLDSLVDSLSQLNETFGEQLDLADSDGISYDQVRTARRKGREAFHKVLFMIYGHYANDPEIRRELLEPVEDQNERIGRSIERNGEPRDVDPDSGEPTDGQSDGGSGNGEPTGGQSDGGSGNGEPTGGQPDGGSGNGEPTDSQEETDGDGEQTDDEQ